MAGILGGVDRNYKSLTLVFQVIPQSYLVSRSLDPLKAEPQEVFVGPNTYSQGMTGRLGLLKEWLVGGFNPLVKLDHFAK